jgi:hypothetical protein
MLGTRWLRASAWLMTVHLRRWRDLGRPPRCIPCTPCQPGFYINTQKCSPAGTLDRQPGDASSCIKCRTCPPMHSLVGTPCSGQTTADTQACSACSAYCPVGTTISPFVERCTGTSWAFSLQDLSRPFDPVTECLTCPACPLPVGQARVSGCSGLAIYDPPQCVDCQSCPRGNYIAGECTLQSSSSESTHCAQCPACADGKYLSRRCTGQSLHAPDHSCEPCARCEADHYIGLCTSASQNTEDWDSNSSVEIPPPADAGICIPCKKCPVGTYISRPCDGTKLVDDSECLPCNQACPISDRSVYMHAACDGTAFSPDSNDCRPCTPCSPGQYMFSGKCVYGGATSPLERVCRDCWNCSEGEYKSSVCTGSDTYQVDACTRPWMSSVVARVQAGMIFVCFATLAKKRSPSAHIL